MKKFLRKYGVATLLVALLAIGALYGSDQPVQQSLDGGTTNFTGLAVSGAVDFDSTLNVDGASTLAGITLSGVVDLNGLADGLVLDAEGNESISAPTEDQIDIEVNGADDFQFTANTFTSLSGSTIASNTIAETTAGSGVTIDSLVVKDGGATLGASGVLDLNGEADALVLDAEANDSISVTTEDQMFFELNGADQIFMRAVAGADSAATNEYFEQAFTAPVDTTGTNTHNAVTVDLALGNSTGGNNHVTGIQIDGITDDDRVSTAAIKIGDEWEYAIDTAAPIMSTAMVYWQDFLGDAIFDSFDEVEGNDAQAVQAIAVEQYGVYQLTAGDAGTGIAADLEAVHFTGLEWSADQGSLVFEVRLHLDTAVTTARVCAGFTDDTATVENAATIATTVITTTASNAVVFCYDTDADTDQWYAIGVATDTDATGNLITGIAPTQDVYQVLRIEIESAGGVARFYIDGALVVTLTANAVTATTLLSPFVSVDSADTAESQVLDIDYVYVGADRD